MKFIEKNVIGSGTRDSECGLDSVGENECVERRLRELQH